MSTTNFGLDRYKVERKPIADGSIVLELPHLPPSTNHLYFNLPGGGRAKTAKYADWIKTAGLFLNSQIKGRVTGRVEIRILVEDCHPQRDASNVTKPVEDLLVRCGVIEDDRSKFVRGSGSYFADIKGVRIEITKVTA